MLPFQALVFCSVLHNSWGSNLSFPSNFKFGAATAAYQIEGGWNTDGKGENIWDRFVHQYPGEVKNNATGDVAADSYHLWREDVKAAAKLQLQFYRFSINWARILPTGFTNEFNKAGAKYYSDLIDSLLAKGIEPVVTLYHWDLPVKIQDLGGWTNPLIVNWFGDYARIVYSLYADRVKTWLTVNEPIVVCDFTYNSFSFAPYIREPVYAPYLCNKHILLAHAKAYRIFDKEFRPRYTGRISLANNLLWIEPATPNDTLLAELGREHQAGRYSHPIFSKEGGWPTYIEKWMRAVSLKDGYKESRLPSFTKEEIEFIKGTADFFGVNHYTTSVIRPAKPGEDPGVWFINGSPELNAVLEPPRGSNFGASPILPIVPEGIRKQLSWIKQQYGDIEILITENGYSSSGYELDDQGRVDFIRKYLEQITTCIDNRINKKDNVTLLEEKSRLLEINNHLPELKVLLSIKVDNVKVIGYAAWSLIDNFEWLEGYTLKFGLFEVDYEHPNRTRTPRASAYYYACIIKMRSLDVENKCFNKNHAVHRARRTYKHNSGKISASNEHLLIVITVFFYFILN